MESKTLQYPHIYKEITNTKLRHRRAEVMTERGRSMIYCDNTSKIVNLMSIKLTLINQTDMKYNRVTSESIKQLAIVLKEIHDNITNGNVKINPYEFLHYGNIPYKTIMLPVLKEAGILSTTSSKNGLWSWNNGEPCIAMAERVFKGCIDYMHKHSTQHILKAKDHIITPIEPTNPVEILQSQIGLVVFGVYKSRYEISSKEAKLTNVIMQGHLNSITINASAVYYTVNSTTCYAIATKLSDIEPQLQDLSDAIIGISCDIV
jgi:hypothetical protein